MKGYSENSSRIKNKGNGFTLIEILSAVLIIGVIAAMTMPNLLKLMSHNRVKEGIATINGAIKETQRQAIREGQQCRININTTTRIISGDPNNCLLQQREINENIIVRHTTSLGTPPSILFSAKGTTTNSGTIVVSSDTTDTQRCFVISLGLGITRTGNYTGAKTGTVSSNDCESE